MTSPDNPEPTLVDNEIPQRWDDDTIVEDPYADLRPVSGEERYAAYDDEFETWAVFGAESGFCYGQYHNEDVAQSHC